jgi:hypothetical protein
VETHRGKFSNNMLFFQDNAPASCSTKKSIKSVLKLPVIYIVPCHQIKKIRVGENGGLNQSKHQNSTIQVTRFFLIDRTLYSPDLIPSNYYLF